MKFQFFTNLRHNKKNKYNEGLNDDASNYEKKSFYYTNNNTYEKFPAEINFRYLEEVYRTNTPVFRCIHMINQCVGSMKITCLGNKTIENYLNCNLPEIINNVLIYGNCFLSYTNNTLQVLPIQQISIIKKADSNKIEMYKTNHQLYKHADMVHLKYTVNPSMSYSISPIQICSKWIQIYDNIQEYINNMMRYGGKPSGIVSYNNTLNEKDRTLLKEQFKELYRSVSSGGTVILTNSSISWQPIGMEPEKLHLLEHLKQATQEIANCFGIPSILLNVNDNITYSNYKEARNQFWDDTLSPLVVNIVESLSLFLKENISINLNRQNNSQLQERIWSEDILSKNEKRKLLGYNTAED